MTFKTGHVEFVVRRNGNVAIVQAPTMAGYRCNLDNLPEWEFGDRLCEEYFLTYGEYPESYHLTWIEED